ncbi:MAG: ribonuclease HI family protein [Deltaproteobacteria bacterium]|nr:ribonuclease HI family protein [Deltaproteobacteria bacterium]
MPRRPTRDEILTVIAEVESLDKTLARFPGLERGDLFAILRGAPAPRAAPAARATAPEPAPAAAAPEAAPAAAPREATPAAEPREATPAAAPREATPAAAAPQATPAAAVRPAAAPEPARSEGGPLVVFTDGASRGNPGPASIGVVISRPDGKVVETISETIGRATNNHAEYEAVRAALSRARDLKADRVDLRADSELVVRQLGGQYQVRSPELRPIYEAIKKLESSFPGGVRYRHVRREQNQEADALANQALDRGY